ncbi:MAG: FAD-binding molybdopterin dehydrogenase [Phycisphaerae bacterium]|nr:FAD-binding molybdopterin dehydrogenase [Phycisphaerae bacterium]|tara:strand:- start:263 stop:1135 length:873 start_codon:yes stop_codon:yes gene_type:complete
MNIAGVKEYLSPSTDDEARQWKPGSSYVAGGTWLYSEQQMSGRITPGQAACTDAPGIDTIIDLMSLGWTPLQVVDAGLEIAATCRIRELLDFKSPSDWKASGLFRSCAEALSASFKIYNEATIGGNICMSLPAGAMISLVHALHAQYTIWPNDGEPYTIPSSEFHTGMLDNALNPGDILRSILLPDEWLKREAIMDLRSLTHVGRSAALVIATRDPSDGQVEFSVSASVTRPYQFAFPSLPTTAELKDVIEDGIPEEAYFDDQHGDVFYRREMTAYLAESLRTSLANGAG